MTQDANGRVPTLSKALLLPLIPFCLLGFLNSLFIVCGAQMMKRSMNRSSLVSFLGSTAKQRTMAFDMTRVFCYSVLQLVFQVSTKSFRIRILIPDQLFFSSSSFWASLLGQAFATPSYFPSRSVLKTLSNVSFL